MVFWPLFEYITYTHIKQQQQTNITHFYLIPRKVELNALNNEKKNVQYYI